MAAMKLANRHNQLLRAPTSSRLARDLNLTAEQAARVLGVLEDHFLARRLPAASEERDQWLLEDPAATTILKLERRRYNASIQNAALVADGGDPHATATDADYMHRMKHIHAMCQYVLAGSNGLSREELANATSIAASQLPELINDLERIGWLRPMTAPDGTRHHTATTHGTDVALHQAQRLAPLMAALDRLSLGRTPTAPVGVPVYRRTSRRMPIGEMLPLIRLAIRADDAARGRHAEVWQPEDIQLLGEPAYRQFVELDRGMKPMRRRPSLKGLALVGTHAWALRCALDECTGPALHQVIATEKGARTGPSYLRRALHLTTEATVLLASVDEFGGTTDGEFLETAEDIVASTWGRFHDERRMVSQLMPSLRSMVHTEGNRVLRTRLGTMVLKALDEAYGNTFRVGAYGAARELNARNGVTDLAPYLLFAAYVDRFGPSVLPPNTDPEAIRQVLRHPDAPKFVADVYGGGDVSIDPENPGAGLATLWLRTLATPAGYLRHDEYQSMAVQPDDTGVQEPDDGHDDGLNVQFRAP